MRAVEHYAELLKGDYFLNCAREEPWTEEEISSNTDSGENTFPLLSQGK